MNYLSSGGGGIGGLSGGAASLTTNIEDSLILYSINSSGVATRIKAMRYNLASNILATLTFTAPVGSVSIKAEFIPGNTALLNYGYYLDNLRLARMTGTNLYSSNFVAGTIVSQNTDGWSTTWATSYMNVLTGSPNKLRVAGQTPAIQRNFGVTPNDNYELTYTQTENNSVTFTVEQSSNGTTGWSTLMNTTSTNGTHTRNFTPTQAYLRVKYSGSAAFSLASMTLASIDVDTSYSVVARGGYRYGFNSMERDDEVKGRGNSYNFGARMYDSRLGRFFSLDRYKERFPSTSPYVFAANTPIWALDSNGDSVWVYSESIVRSWGVGRHMFIRVKTAERDVIIELYGPYKEVGQPHVENYKPSDLNREDVIFHQVWEPINKQDPDKFENDIIKYAEYIKSQNVYNKDGKVIANALLPKYSTYNTNSNGYIRSLIEYAGGSVEVQKYYFDLNIFEDSPMPSLDYLPGAEWKNLEPYFAILRKKYSVNEYYKNTYGLTLKEFNFLKSAYDKLNQANEAKQNANPSAPAVSTQVRQRLFVREKAKKKSSKSDL